MVLIRPVCENDLDQLLELAGLTGFGLTTLPQDRQWLERRVREALLAMDKIEGDPPRGEAFLFVMEDLRTGQVVGTCGITSKVGGFEPFYAYRIETDVHESKMLGVRKEIKTLHLVAEHNGPCEIGSLFLAPSHRQSGNGRLLSLARFLFIAKNPTYFDPTVIAEMRGDIDDRGQSPFWNAVGKHFFEIDLPKADHLSIVNKKFIADLMPHHPVYIPLLPTEAQRVIGQVHEQTRPALAILESQGFSFSGMVDIFEAGPVMVCERDRIAAVRESQSATVEEIVEGGQRIEADEWVVASGVDGFRATRARLTHSGSGVTLEHAAALALGVKVGDRVRCVPLRPGKRAADPAVSS